jgi:hypothetical protein
MSLIHIRFKENYFEISYSENSVNLSGLKEKIDLNKANPWWSWDNITEEYKNTEIKYRMVCDVAYKQNEIRKDGFAHKWKML